MLIKHVIAYGTLGFLVLGFVWLMVANYLRRRALTSPERKAEDGLRPGDRYLW